MAGRLPGARAAVQRGPVYAARHNPFVYFHSMVDAPDCNAGVVNLDKLEADLKSTACQRG